MQTSSRLSRGYIIALTATVLWSFTGILISYLSKTYSLPSLVLAFWRDLFVSIGMVVGLLIFSRTRFYLAREHWGFMVLYGFTLAIFNSMWTFSVQYNGAAVATVMAFSSPAMTAILSRIFFKEQIQPYQSDIHSSQPCWYRSCFRRVRSFHMESQSAGDHLRLTLWLDVRRL